MSPDEIDALITRIEADEEIDIRPPYGMVQRLTTHHLDDLYLARDAARMLEAARPRLEAALADARSMSRPTNRPGASAGGSGR